MLAQMIFLSCSIITFGYVKCTPRPMPTSFSLVLQQQQNPELENVDDDSEDDCKSSSHPRHHHHHDHHPYHHHRVLMGKLIHGEFMRETK